jgi:23S rRNA pseudouridine1911/1915/1917 synthase
MMKKEFQIKPGDEGSNIKEYLAQQAGLSARRIKQLLKAKKIQINGRPAYFDNSVRSGDLIRIDLEDTGRDSIVPQELPLDIIFEDEYFLGANKPAGMLVHPTQNFPDGTLSNAVKYHFKQQGLDIPVRLINRIDMDTSGIVLIAKSGEAHSAFAARFRQEDCRKYYLALAEGRFEEQKGPIDAPIGLDEANPLRRAVRTDGQNSLTEYEVLEQYEEAALIRLRLVTGRTHQIRVHMSSMGHPLLGDVLYGGNTALIRRQALHASQLRVVHPFTAEAIDLGAALPEDMQNLIEQLRKETHTGVL